MDEGFVRHWQRIGPKLEEIRRKELAAFDHQANWENIDSGVSVPPPHRTHDEWIGRSTETAPPATNQRAF